MDAQKENVQDFESILNNLNGDITALEKNMEEMSSEYDTLSIQMKKYEKEKSELGNKISLNSDEIKNLRHDYGIETDNSKKGLIDGKIDELSAENSGLEANIGKLDTEINCLGGKLKLQKEIADAASVSLKTLKAEYQKSESELEQHKKLEGIDINFSKVARMVNFLRQKNAEFESTNSGKKALLEEIVKGLGKISSAQNDDDISKELKNIDLLQKKLYEMDAKSGLFEKIKKLKGKLAITKPLMNLLPKMFYAIGGSKKRILASSMIVAALLYSSLKERTPKFEYLNLDINNAQTTAHNGDRIKLKSSDVLEITGLVTDKACNECIVNFVGFEGPGKNPEDRGRKIKLEDLIGKYRMPDGSYRINVSYRNKKLAEIFVNYDKTKIDKTKVDTPNLKGKARSYYEKGNEFFKKKAYKKAMEFYKNAVTFDPSNNEYKEHLKHATTSNHNKTSHKSKAPQSGFRQSIYPLDVYMDSKFYEQYSPDTERKIEEIIKLASDDFRKNFGIHLNVTHMEKIELPDSLSTSDEIFKYFQKTTSGRISGAQLLFVVNNKNDYVIGKAESYGSRLIVRDLEDDVCTATILKHELGHIFGASHSSDENSIMFDTSKYHSYLSKSMSCIKRKWDLASKNAIMHGKHKFG